VTACRRTTHGRRREGSLVVIKAIDHKFGYDQPLYVQYEKFAKGIFVGGTYGEGKAAFQCPAPCLGYSFLRNEDVTTLLEETLPVTAQLALGGFVFWIVGGIGVGIIAALKRGKWQDRTIVGLALIGYSFPSFSSRCYSSSSYR
jgi:peptide/nickel transport system permease protein